ncbi:MAG: Gfo/Idh/MocA family oxidoreductase [Treponema sp.]|nr:Gfo/Idh/MocA family oxidoreductase [Treponema sp.]
MMKTAVIGLGNMGSKYACLIQDGNISGMELAALTRIKEQYQKALEASINKGIPVFDSADDLFDAVQNNKLKLDAVIICTPHYSHEKIACRAFELGLNVLCEKPLGVFSRQSRNMLQAAKTSGKNLSVIFQLRTKPVYKELKRIVESKKYGKLKRMHWLITDWYRPEGYYTSSSWHSNWKTDGGGVILNQCPHNLDLLQWICGMPARLQAFCHEGKYHNIEVEDDVTVYFEWPDGATGTFVASTGDAPGVNRIELFLDEALIICENDTLKIGELLPELGTSEAQYRRNSMDFFKPIQGTWTTNTLPAESNPYQKVLQAFCDECISNGKSVAEGLDGHKTMIISNAIYLSSWQHKMIELPLVNSKEEIKFEKKFEKEMKKKF